jgi:hypothetical protein
LITCVRRRLFCVAAAAAFSAIALGQVSEPSPPSSTPSVEKTPTPRPRITGASNPGGVTLSTTKLKAFQGALTGKATSLPAQMTDDRLDEHLMHGDSRAAVVIRTQPDLLVAAYSDELDCVIMLRFDASLASTYDLNEGSRLLTINTYGRRPSEDLHPGPKDQHRWTSVYPLIAEFLSDEMDRIRARKSRISEEEWQRALEEGKSYVTQDASVARDGNPYLSGSPARGGAFTSPLRAATAAQASSEKTSTYSPSFPIEAKGSGSCRLSVERASIRDQPNSLFVIHGSGFTPETELKVSTRSENEAASIPHAKSLADGSYKLVMAPAVVGKAGGEATVTVADGQCSVTARYPWGTATTLWTESSQAVAPTTGAAGSPGEKPTPSVEELARRLPSFNPIKLGLAATELDNEMVFIRLLQAKPEKMTVQLGTETVDRNNVEAVAARLDREKGMIAAEIDKRGYRDIAGPYDVRSATQSACDLRPGFRNFNPHNPWARSS